MTRLAALLLLGFLLAFGAPRPASAQIRLDLRDVDLRSYIQLVAEQTGRNFLVDPEVQGTVSVFAPVPVTPASMYEIFLNVLEINGLTILEGEGIDRIVPMHAASGLASGTARAQRGGAYETRVIPVRSGDIVEMYDVLEPLVAPDAILTPIPSAGLIVLSDRTENIARIEALVDRLNSASSRSVETIRLNHGRAADMITVLQAALPPSAATGTIAADAGANAIVVSGPSEFRDRVRSVVVQLDTPQMRPTSRVVRLNFAQATDLAEVIRQSMGAGGEGDAAITIVAEPQSNAILITAQQERIDAISRAI